MTGLTVVYGTRPEARKLGPVLAALRGRGVPLTLLDTGQHPALTAFAASLPAFAGQVDLGLPNLGQSPDAYVATLTDALLPHLDGAHGPVLVQGDTATALAGATAAATLGRPVYHLEAGVRTGHRDDPWPEEGFRIQIDRLADAGCCATPGNQLALQHEGHDFTRFPVTGNPGIDALLADQPPVTTRWDHVLVTLHRRESFGPRLEGFITALAAWAAPRPGTPVYWPLHPNPQVATALQRVGYRPQTRVGGLPPNLVLLPALDPPAFLPLLAHAHVVLTDSGGVQEEAAALGVPCVVARQHTDRPESVAEGLALLAPTPADLDWTLTAAATGTLRAAPAPTYGDGLATPRILDHLQTLYPTAFPTPA